MSYKVEWLDGAKKDLKKIDTYQKSLILKWVHKNLENCEEPRQHGKALVGEFAGLWRYRVGDYRIIAKILDNIVTINVVAVGHRKEIYKN